MMASSTEGALRDALDRFKVGHRRIRLLTFWGLDIVTKSKVDHLHVNLAGNASSGMPTVRAGLPGMESIAASMMKKQSS